MFEMTVEDTFTIKGRGTVISGVLLSGQPTSGEKVVIEADGRPRVEARLSGVETLARSQKVGLLMRDVAPKDVPRGARIRSADR